MAAIRTLSIVALSFTEASAPALAVLSSVSAAHPSRPDTWLEWAGTTRYLRSPMASCGSRAVRFTSIQTRLEPRKHQSLTNAGVVVAPAFS